MDFTGQFGSTAGLFKKPQLLICREQSRMKELYRPVTSCWREWARARQGSQLELGLPLDQKKALETICSEGLKAALGLKQLF